MTKPKLPLAEFYITNVCNFNCDNCNRMNNYYFSGHQLWKDYAEVYREFSTKLDIDKINILGGEPMLNPSLIEWVEGIRSYWPNAEIDIVSNGTRLKYWDNFYNVLKDNRVKLSLTTHNAARHSTIVQEVTELLQAPITKRYQGDLSRWHKAYLDVKDPSWPDCNSANDFENLPKHIQEECRIEHQVDPENFLKNTNDLYIVDANGVECRISYAVGFVTAPLRYAGDNQFKVYNSVPEEAHDVCHGKYCHEFVQGKLYKCHHVALLPEFMKQYYVDISDSDLALLNSYKPLTADQSIEEYQNFVNGIRNTMPQCKLCPSKLETILLQSSTDKPKVVKLKYLKNK
jgi:organic radical activating enzyme